MPPRSPAQGFREGASDNRKADQHCCSDPHLHIAAPLDLANDAALAVSRREDSQVVDSQTPNRLDAGALLASLSGRCQAFCRILPVDRRKLAKRPPVFLKQLQNAEEERSMRWQCKDCRWVKHFTRPVPREVAGKCPRCKWIAFEVVS